MRFKLTYTSPDGDSFSLLQGKTGPFIEEGTVSGLVGEFEDTTVQTPGVPGGNVAFKDRVISPMTGGFTVVAHNEEEWARTRRAFSTWRYGQLHLECGGSQYWTPFRLARPITSPEMRPDIAARTPIEGVSDGPNGGVWNTHVTSKDPRVTVTNFGDVPVWPEYVWEGNGGRVTLPSGAGFNLPKVTGVHRLPLIRTNSGKIYGPEGVDHELSRTTGAVSEMTPVGTSRTYTQPAGSTLTWNVGVLDPWN